jgi:hypothetical protein
LSGLISALIGSIALVIFKITFPQVSTDILAISSTLAVIVFLVVLRTHRSLALGGVVALLVLVVLTYFITPKGAMRGGTYIIVDMSENMQAAYQGVDISGIINLTARGVPDNMDLGLMVFGGFIPSDNDCMRISPIVPPAPKSISIPEIEKAVSSLSNFKPQGYGTVEQAILQAINSLSGRPNVQEIIIITSGLDERCGQLDRNLIEIAAQEKNVKFAITIILVGEQSSIVEEKYNLFKDKIAFVEAADQVPSTVSGLVVEPIFSYYAPPGK